MNFTDSPLKARRQRAPTTNLPHAIVTSATAETFASQTRRQTERGGGGDRARVGRGGERGTEGEETRVSERTEAGQSRERGRKARRDAYAPVCDRARALFHVTVCVQHTSHVGGLRMQSPWQQFFLYGYQGFKWPTCAAGTSGAWSDEGRYGFSCRFQAVRLECLKEAG